LFTPPGYYNTKTLTSADKVTFVGDNVTFSNSSYKTESLNKHSSQLADIAINVKSFGAKGDGVTDDTQSFLDMTTVINNTSGKNVIIPDGEYIISSDVDFELDDSIIQFFGDIKMKDGIQTPFGLLGFVGDNIVINNLTINGNYQNAIDEGSFGISALLTIGSLTNSKFNNLTLNNAMYSAIVSSGNCRNVEFNRVTMDDIGEHCFYISGGLNTNFEFNDLDITDFGVYSERGQTAFANHACFIIKSRGDTYGDNDYFKINGVELTINLVASEQNALIALPYLNNLEILNANISGVPLVNSNSMNANINLFITDCNALRVSYGIFNSLINVELFSSTFETVDENLLSFNLVENCEFTTLPSSTSVVGDFTTKEQIKISNSVFNFKSIIFLKNQDFDKKVIFDSCAFINSGSAIPFNIDDNFNYSGEIVFKECYVDPALSYLLRSDPGNINAKATFIDIPPTVTLTLSEVNMSSVKYINCNELKGATAGRPTVNINETTIFFDTTLGIPIWYNGTDWVNSVGTTV